jgi:hypothetical protein
MDEDRNGSSAPQTIAVGAEICQDHRRAQGMRISLCRRVRISERWPTLLVNGRRYCSMLCEPRSGET